LPAARLAARWAVLAMRHLASAPRCRARSGAVPDVFVRIGETTGVAAPTCGGPRPEQLPTGGNGLLESDIDLLTALDVDSQGHAPEAHRLAGTDGGVRRKVITAPHGKQPTGSTEEAHHIRNSDNAGGCSAAVVRRGKDRPDLLPRRIDRFRTRKARDRNRRRFTGSAAGRATLLWALSDKGTAARPGCTATGPLMSARQPRDCCRARQLRSRGTSLCARAVTRRAPSISAKV